MNGRVLALGLMPLVGCHAIMGWEETEEKGPVSGSSAGAGGQSVAGAVALHAQRQPQSRTRWHGLFAGVVRGAANEVELMAG